METKQMLLIKHRGDYADEFTTEGFVIMDENEFDKKIKRVKEYFDAVKEVEIYFGTNEFWQYSSFNEFMSEHEITKITTEEAEIITRLVADHGDEFGMVPLTCSDFSFDDDDYDDEEESEEQ